LNITDLADDANVSVGVCFFGSDLVFPRRFYQGFAPPIWATEVQLQSNVSVGGNLIGTSVVAKGSTMSFTVNNVDPEFIRGVRFPFFAKSFNEGAPFFMAWRPKKYDGDLYYCWRDGGTLRPTNSGPRDLMSVELSCRVYEG
jgi:hypothetical protein